MAMTRDSDALARILEQRSIQVLCTAWNADRTDELMTGDGDVRLKIRLSGMSLAGS